jgi:hypothetical protein
MKFLSLEKKIEISFYTIIIFFTFYTYTFFAIISKNYNFLFTVITIFLYIIFHKIYSKNNLKISFKILNIEILSIFLLLIIGLILNFQDLKFSLEGDEFSTALRTQRTSIYSSFIFLKLIDIEILKKINFNKVVYLFSFIEIIFLTIVAYLISKKKNLYLIALLILFTLLFRIYLKDFGMHPPVNHLSSFIITSIFGFTDYGFRFSYLLIYVFGNIVLLYQLNRIFKNRILNLLIILFLFTIPISLLSSTNVDHNSWGYVFLLNFLFYFYFNKKLNYEMIVLFITIFSMARITNFILILPLFYIYFLENKKNFQIKKFLLTFLPVIFFLPFVLKLILLGSNVHSSGVSTIYLGIAESLKDNSFLKSAIFFVPNYIFVFSFLGFLLFIFKEKINNRGFAIILTFFIYLIIYSSISSQWIGHPKYIFEFIMPFLVLFLIIFSKFNTKIMPIILITLIFFNILNIKKFKSIVYVNEIENKKFQIRHRFDYKAAFRSIKNKNLNLSNYHFGVYYGFVTEILNDFKFNELVVVNNRNLEVKGQIYKKVDLKLFFEINDNIESVLVTESDYTLHKNIFKDWRIIDKFYYEEYKHNKLIHLMK